MVLLADDDIDRLNQSIRVRYRIVGRSFRSAGNGAREGSPRHVSARNVGHRAFRIPGRRQSAADGPAGHRARNCYGEGALTGIPPPLYGWRWSRSRAPRCRSRQLHGIPQARAEREGASGTLSANCPGSPAMAIEDVGAMAVGRFRDGTPAVPTATIDPTA